VTTMLKAIKKRVDDLKKDDNWKQKIIKKHEEKEQKNDDQISNHSVASEAKSVASEKS